MKTIIGVALIVALATGAAACSDRSPSGPDDTNSTAPPGTTPNAPPGPTPSPLEQIVYVGNGMTLIKSDGSGAVQLGPGWSPAWSPDGSRLMFSNTRCETDWETYYRCDSGGLQIMNPETRDVTTLAAGALGVEPAWAPNGDMIAFVRHDLPGRLFLMRLDGSELRQLSFPFVHEVLSRPGLLMVIESHSNA